VKQNQKLPYSDWMLLIHILSPNFVAKDYITLYATHMKMDSMPENTTYAVIKLLLIIVLHLLGKTCGSQKTDMT
jgi:hypothetical protein